MAKSYGTVDKMTALQLILFNTIIIGGVGLLVYAMTHGGNNTKKDDSSSKHHL